jgi:hypothetical protein
MSYEAYNAYLSVTKSTPSDIYKDEFQELVNAEYENTTTLKTVLHNGNSITVRVVGKFNAETLSRQNENYQKIIFRTPDYVVHVGDIFEFDNAKWICTDISSTVVSKSCTVTKANNEIKVYKNSILYKVPCIVEDAIRLYSMGIDTNKYIVEPNTNVVVRVANNAITSLIARNDIYRIGANNYKVIDISDIINPGLIVLKLNWTAEEQVLPNTTSDIVAEYEIVGDADIIKNYSETYTANKYNNGVLVPDAQFDFIIIPGDTPISAYTLTIISDTQCSIKANASTYYITLRAIDRIDNTKHIEKTIRLKSVL